MRKTTRILSVIVALVVLVAAFSVAIAQDEPTVLRTELGESDVPTLDPALATDSSSIQILNETYTGLTALDVSTAEVVPGIAESWEVTENEDGTVTYTFSIIPELPWVQYNAETGAVEQVMIDGAPRYVTAADVEYGWTRTLDPRTAGDYAYVLAGQVIGAQEFNTQEVGEDGALTLGAETLGFAATDTYTFEVTVPAARAFQPAIFGLWMARPQPQWVIEEFGDLWIEPENFVSYGPWALKEWARDEYITIIANPFWPGTEYIQQPSIDEVQFNFLDSVTALAEYEAGNLDDLDTVDTASIPRIQADPVLSQELVTEPGSCSYYYGFGTNIEPFNNVHMRRAFSFAIDREAIVNNVTQGGEIAATYFTLPSVAAAPTPEQMDEQGFGIGYDPEAAVEEFEIGLEELGYASADELPPITLLYNTSEGHRRIAEAIRDMWADTLGVDVQLTNQDFGVYLDQRAEFQVWRAGWCFDYPDANSFIFDVFHSSSNNNDTGWTNEEFDALVEQAASETDPAVRAELYAQAEQILVFDEAAIIPIYWYSDVELTKPYVERTYAVDNTEQYETWTINR